MNQIAFAKWAHTRLTKLTEFGVLVSVLTQGDSAMLETVFQNREGSDSPQLVAAQGDSDARLIHAIMALNEKVCELSVAFNAAPEVFETALGEILIHYAILCEMFNVPFYFDVKEELVHEPMPGLLFLTAGLMTNLRRSMFTNELIDVDYMINSLQGFGTYLGAVVAGSGAFQGWDKLMEKTQARYALCQENLTPSQE